MKIEPKDIKKHLSLKGIITVSGKHANIITRKFLNKYKNGIVKIFKQVKDSIVNTVTNIKDTILPDEETIQKKTEEVREKRIQKVDTKRYELYQLKNELEKDDEYRIGRNLYYLNEIKNELRKLDKKKAKVSSKTLSIYTLTKLAFVKIKNNTKNSWIKYKEKINEQKKQKEIELAKERLKANYERIIELKRQEREILEKYPEINREDITNTITKIDDGKELEVTETNTKVTEVKNPSKEEKEKIKKSVNFKKALTAMTVITGISLGSSIVTDNIDINSNSKEVSINNSTQIEYNINNQNEQREVVNSNIKLGDYLTIENGSTIYEKPELSGNHGIIGRNEYNDQTLFKINAITYVDENGIETTFNTVQKTEQAKKLIEEKHKQYIENNSNITVKNFHVTPCNELGIPDSKNEKDMDLGGWTNEDNSKIKNVDISQVVMNAYDSLGGRVL